MTREAKDYLRGHECEASPCGYLTSADATDIWLEERAAKPPGPCRWAPRRSRHVKLDAERQLERGKRLVESGVSPVTNIDMADMTAYLAWERPWVEFERRFLEWCEAGCFLTGGSHEYCVGDGERQEFVD